MTVSGGMGTRVVHLPFRKARRMAYEYKVVDPSETGVNLHNFEAYLNLMGKRDWELVNIDDKGQLVFMRQIAVGEKIRNFQLKESDENDTS